MEFVITNLLKSNGVDDARLSSSSSCSSPFRSLPMSLAALPSHAVLGVMPTCTSRRRRNIKATNARRMDHQCYGDDNDENELPVVHERESSSSRSICSGLFSNNDDSVVRADDDDASSSSTTESCASSSSSSPEVAGALATTTRDSLLVYLGRQQEQNQKLITKHHDDDDDDDTVSTATNTSVADDDEDDVDGNLSLSTRSSMSALSLCSTGTTNETDTTITAVKRVSFATNLVSQVHTRPVTKPSDKYYLYYNEYDYMDFKLHYMSRGRSKLCKRTSTKVGWKLDVVDSVHPVMDPTTRQHHDLYYTEPELQGFLDDFVVSLQQQQQQRSSLS